MEIEVNPSTLQCGLFAGVGSDSLADRRKVAGDPTNPERREGIHHRIIGSRTPGEGRGDKRVECGLGTSREKAFCASLNSILACLASFTLLCVSRHEKRKAVRKKKIARASLVDEMRFDSMTPPPSIPLLS